MREVIYVSTPLEVTFRIETDPSGLFVGQIAEYPGLITQGRTERAVKRKLIRLLREVGREHPEELALFR